MQKIGVIVEKKAKFQDMAAVDIHIFQEFRTKGRGKAWHWFAPGSSKQGF